MDRRVVVVGMGDTGVLVATRLSRHAQVTGVSTTPVFVSGQELGTRLARPGQWRQDYLQSFRAYRRLRGVDVVHGAVTSVDLSAREVEVTTAEGPRRRLPYDVLVVASGTTNGFWRRADVRTQAEVDAGLEQAADVVAAASTVAVVGGGPSGVSVASNVADVHRHARVDLFHSGELPLAGYHRRTRERVVRRLDAQGVHRHPGHRAIVPQGAAATLGPGTIAFSTGQPAVDADVVVWAVGRVEPNTGFLPAELLDEAGFVQVGPTLQSSARSEVFAVGDVAATDPNRSSARNFGHRVAAANVRAVLDRRPDRFREFRPPRHRWGSILGVQDDGMRIHTPRGGVVPLTRSFARRVLFPVFTHRLIYGGLRRDR